MAVEIENTETPVFAIDATTDEPVNVEFLSNEPEEAPEPEMHLVPVTIDSENWSIQKKRPNRLKRLGAALFISAGFLIASNIYITNAHNSGENIQPTSAIDPPPNPNLIPSPEAQSFTISPTPNATDNSCNGKIKINFEGAPLSIHDKSLAIYHVIQKGETLTRLALEYGLRDSSGNLEIKKLAKFNNIKNPNLIYEGSNILIPLKAVPLREGETTTDLSKNSVGGNSNLQADRQKWQNFVDQINSIDENTKCPLPKALIVPGF